MRVGGGSEAGSYLRLMDSVYHSTLGLRVITKKKKAGEGYLEPSSTGTLSNPLGVSDLRERK